MSVYQFGYLDELRGFGDRPICINPLWFWACHPDEPQGRPRMRPPIRPLRHAPRQLPDDAQFHLAWQLLSKKPPA